MTPASLRSWRRRRRLSQREAAAAFGLSARQWLRYEAGQQPIPKTLELAVGYVTLTELWRFPPLTAAGPDRVADR